MRGLLVAMVSVGFMVTTACSGSSTTSTTSGTSGSTTSGTTTGTGTGGSTGSSTTGTTGTTGAGTLPAGDPCTGNGQCVSGACGVDGTGRCCSAPCATSDATCGATSCNSSGTCEYPAQGMTCGGTSCAFGLLTTNGCNGQGGCVAQTPTACPNNLVCQDATSCKTSCAATADCAAGYYCDTGTNQCLVQTVFGACTTNAECTSGICGINGTGNCCTAACSTSDATCGASGCDATSGACTYPVGASCGVDGGESCTGSTLTAHICDATGACGLNPAPCAKHFACAADGVSCLTTCSVLADCASGYYCNNGNCLAQEATGICNTNDQCTSGICGINGTGHFCCTMACSTTDPICGATDCGNSGACLYPGKNISCGPAESCTGTMYTAATVCDSMGSCPAPAVSDCTPYTCAATSCFTSCSDSTSCASGDFCDTTGTACCVGLTAGSTLNVDGVSGKDNACCGVGTNGACLTITKAMQIINDAQAQNITLNVTVDGGGGDWTPATEVYPINLGWGVEVKAPGVFFADLNDANAPTGTFEISNYPNDTLHYASMVGTATKPIGLGMDSTNANQTSNQSSVVVDSSQTLYIANATANGNATIGATNMPLLVQAGGTLTLGQDQSGNVKGTVHIGNKLGVAATDGYIGIYCNTDGISLGCTVNDAVMPAGQSSVIIEGQEAVDLLALDYANITLSSNPIFGVPPTKEGFLQCPSKQDGVLGPTFSAVLGGVYAWGQANISLSNALIQCITGVGVQMLKSQNGDGNPTVTIDSSVIQNTDIGVYGTAGSATVTNSTITFNAIGVQQDSDGTNVGTIDLSGGGNAVVCSSNQESSQMTINEGIDVYNVTDAGLKADNVAWDTAGPDYFDCNGISGAATCTCEIATCSASAPFDDMDAVQNTVANGGITQTGATQSGLSLDAGCK